MNRSRSILLAVTIWTAVAATPVFAAPDEYDDSQSHPLRIAAYLLHPAAWLVEWTVFRRSRSPLTITECRKESQRILPVHPHHRLPKKSRCAKWLKW